MVCIVERIIYFNGTIQEFNLFLAEVRSVGSLVNNFKSKNIFEYFCCACLHVVNNIIMLLHAIIYFIIATFNILVNSNSIDILSNSTDRSHVEVWSVASNVDYYSTKGNQIVDKNGKAYRIRGINWYKLGKISITYYSIFISLYLYMYTYFLYVCNMKLM